MERIVIVEDEELVSDFIQMALQNQGYQFDVYGSAEDALKGMIESETRPKLILLDIGLPGLDGFSFLEELGWDDRFGDVPVIIQTASHDSDSIRKGVELGAFFYLTKPLDRELLVTVARQAIGQQESNRRLTESLHEHRAICRLSKSATYEFQTLEEARELASGLAHFYPEPERMLTGILELLVNAVEHGNLEISYQEKGELLRSDQWEAEIERRLSSSLFMDRRVLVEVERRPTQIRMSIEDQGEGFDFTKYMEFDPERAFDPHGRGIAMAKMMSFDQLEYQGRGNRVTATVFTNRLV